MTSSRTCFPLSVHIWIPSWCSYRHQWLWLNPAMFLPKCKVIAVFKRIFLLPLSSGARLLRPPQTTFRSCRAPLFPFGKAFSLSFSITHGACKCIQPFVWQWYRQVVPCMRYICLYIYISSTIHVSSTSSIATWLSLHYNVPCHV